MPYLDTDGLNALWTKIKGLIPNVPAWAMASSKPTYTASEVGAVAKSGDTMTGSLEVSGDISADSIDVGQYLINGAPLAIGGSTITTGTTNGWTWYKWDNGLFLCWQSKTFNSVSFSTTGSYFRRGTVTVPAAPFSTVEVRGMVFNDGNYSGYGWSGNQFTGFSKSVDVYSTASGTLNSVGVQFVAVGRWQ